MGPAETSGYMIAGYGVLFSIMAIYLVSLVVRWRSLRQDEQAYEELEKSQAAPTGAGQANPPA